MRDPSEHTAFIYGEQTWGALFAESDGEPIPATDNNALPYIQQSLNILQLPPEALKKMHVLNIGSGREAIHFHELGAGQVTHLDIAKANVENTRRYAKRKGIENLTSLQADIQTAELPSDEFDLIFLAGVYSIILNPARALVNLARILKPGGKIYFGFSRSGEWKYFILDTIRHLLDRRWFALTKRKIVLSCAFGNEMHYQTKRMLDDFFAPCQHKFHPNDVIHDAHQLGLAVDHFDNDFREYAHEGSDYFSIGGDRIYLVKEKPFQELPPAKLRTTRGRHQLWDVPYQEASIRANLDLIERVRTYVDHGIIPPDDVAVLAINLYRLTRPFDPEHDEYYQRAIQNGRHQTLNEFLQNVLNYYGRTQ